MPMTKTDFDKRVRWYAARGAEDGRTPNQPYVDCKRDGGVSEEVNIQCIAAYKRTFYKARGWNLGATATSSSSAAGSPPQRQQQQTPPPLVQQRRVTPPLGQPRRSLTAPGQQQQGQPTPARPMVQVDPTPQNLSPGDAGKQHAQYGWAPSFAGNPRFTPAQNKEWSDEYFRAYQVERARLLALQWTGQS